MDDYNFMDYMDEDCPSCGALSGEDCYDTCQGVPVPPQMYQFVDEQMAYATHKIGRKIMKTFEKKIFTDKLKDVMDKWGDFTNLAVALKNAKVLNTAEDVIQFIAEPNKFTRYFVLWTELGKPIDEDRETWTMFMKAIENGKQT